MSTELWRSQEFQAILRTASGFTVRVTRLRPELRLAHSPHCIAAALLTQTVPHPHERNTFGWSLGKLLVESSSEATSLKPKAPERPSPLRNPSCTRPVRPPPVRFLEVPYSGESQMPHLVENSELRWWHLVHSWLTVTPGDFGLLVPQTWHDGAPAWLSGIERSRAREREVLQKLRMRMLGRADVVRYMHSVNTCGCW